jgi:hypothetical protein
MQTSSLLRRPRPSGAVAPPGTWALAARFAGALALVVVGVVHLQQYLDLYSTIPTIGTLFLLNFAGAASLAIVLLTPVERWFGRRGGAVSVLAALAGVALCAIAYASLEISERSSLFGFHEPGYDPTAIAVTRVAEIAAAVLLTAYVIARRRTSTSRW